MNTVQQRLRSRKRREAFRRQHRRRIPIWPFAVLVILLLGGVGSAAGAGIYSIRKYDAYTALLTNPADKIASDQGPAILYDRAGNQLYEYEDKNTGLKEPVPLDAISPWVTKATIATEDPDFRTNRGINQRGLIRAGCENLHLCSTASSQATGGSGITQQLVKLLFEPPDEQVKRSVDRKLKEAALAVELTKRYTKDQILEWYLNTIFYANRANGIGAAAKIYFGVHASDLDLAQASLLAGIPASPGDYDPIANYSAAKARQADVLELMVKHDQATQAEADAAAAEPLDLKEQTTVIKEPHWVSFMTDYIKQHCKELVPDCKSGDDALYHRGLRIITTLDSDLTDQATALTDKRVAEYEKANCGCHNGAAMVIDNSTGQILAMVGSRDYYREDIGGKNNNTLAEYQPGSALKPIVYLSTFVKGLQSDGGWSPGTIINDAPKCYPNANDKPFCPSGPTGFNGPVPVRTALGSSLNSPAVQAADFATVPGVINEAHKMGINTMPDASQYGVSIATGGSSVTLYDMTYMYSTLANDGEMRGLKIAEPKEGYRQVDPVAVLTIRDRADNVLYQFNTPDKHQAEDARYVYEITDIIKDDTAKRLIYSPHLFDLKDGRPIAAKTGTQQGQTIDGIRATWNFGYIPDITVGVWVGNSDGSFVTNITSASSSLLLWKDVMQLAVDKYNIPPKNFLIPQGVVMQKGTPVPAGSRVNGCGFQPDIYVDHQNVAGAPLISGAKSCQILGTPAATGPLTQPILTQPVQIVTAPALQLAPPTALATVTPPLATQTSGDAVRRNVVPVQTVPPAPTDVPPPIEVPAPTEAPAPVATQAPPPPQAAPPPPAPMQPAPVQPAAPARAPAPPAPQAPLPAPGFVPQPVSQPTGGQPVLNCPPAGAPANQRPPGC